MDFFFSGHDSILILLVFAATFFSPFVSHLADPEVEMMFLFCAQLFPKDYRTKFTFCGVFSFSPHPLKTTFMVQHAGTLLLVFRLLSAIFFLGKII